jgi:hypothetical protein
MSLQSIRGRPNASSRSWACNTVKVSAGRRIPLLLADRRQDMDAAVFDFNGGGLDPACLAGNLDMVKPGDVKVLHFVGDGVISVPGQPIDAGSDQEMRPEFLGQTEQFVDVALTVGDVNTAFRDA